MRRATSVLAMTAVLALAGCGDDGEEPPESSDGGPVVEQPADADTMAGADAGSEGAAAGDGAAADEAGGGQAGQAGAPGAESPRQAAGERTRRAPGQGQGQPSGQAAGTADTPGQQGRSGQPEPAVRGPDGGRLYTAQVAAFVSPDSARKWTGRLESLELPAWTSMTEFEGRTFYRVRVGAVSNVDDARRLGALLTERFEWPVWVTTVTPSDPMPADAIASTRRVLGD